MSKHFIRQIEKLKRMILTLGGFVEQSVEQAIRAIEDRDVDLARAVIDNDTRIDILEVDIEEECLHTLALYNPVASDMRFVVSIVKINRDLERIGDLAVNLAEQAIFLADEPRFEPAPFDLGEECSRVRSMLKRSLDALVNHDAELAKRVRDEDDAVDAIHRGMYQKVEDAIRQNPDDVARLIDLLNVSRHLEHIADLAVSISEDVVYMVKGDILRHDSREQEASSPINS
jgi:phosphate transport system protein